MPFVKNDPVELGRLERLVPRFTKSSTVGEIMARVRFLQMVQLIPVISVGSIPSIPENFHRVEPFHLTFHPKKKKKVFRRQMVSAPFLALVWPPSTKSLVNSTRETSSKINCV